MLDRFFNPYPTIYKWDRAWLGFVLGMTAPVIVIFVFFIGNKNDLPQDYLNVILENNAVLSPTLSLGVIGNLFVFFLFMWQNYMNSARGVILATFIWAIPIIYTKFF